MDAKLTILISITVLVMIGYGVEPLTGANSLYGSIISNLGQAAVLIVAALIGFDSVKLFGTKSRMGKAALFISIGLLCWALGALTWFYYSVFAHTDVPYPSVADLFYLANIPVAAFGILQLIKGMKAKLELWRMLVAGAVVLAAGFGIVWFFMLSKFGEEVPALTKALNVAYPFGDMIIFAFAAVLLSLTQGSLLRKSLIVIALGYILAVAADLAFSYEISLNAYSLGNWSDLLYLLAYCVTGIGLYLLYNDHQKLAQTPQ